MFDSPFAGLYTDRRELMEGPSERARAARWSSDPGKTGNIASTRTLAGRIRHSIGLDYHIATRKEASTTGEAGIQKQMQQTMTNLLIGGVIARSRFVRYGDIDAACTFIRVIAGETVEARLVSDLEHVTIAAGGLHRGRIGRRGRRIITTVAGADVSEDNRILQQADVPAGT